MKSFNYGHIRAKEARLEHTFGSTPLKVLMGIVAAAGYVLGGLTLFLQHSSLGWLLVAVAILLSMFLAWLNIELKHLPARGEKSICDLLSKDVLYQLGKNPSLSDLAKIIPKTKSGGFLETRYGMIDSFLQIVAEGINGDIDTVFEEAMKVYKKTKSEQVSGGVLAVAMLQCNPKHEDLLRAFKLDIKDLYDGVTWYNYLHGVVKGIKQPRHTGGVGRDLSFGYTPLLQQFAQNVSSARENSAKMQIHQASSQAIIGQMVKTFSNGGRQNIALVGPEGSGRKTIVYAFADMLLDADSDISSKLKYRQILKLDATAMISVASERGELENLMNRIMVEAYSAKNIILWLDNAQYFFEEGVGSVDISKVILPVLQAGRLRMILTMEQQKFLEISSKNSQLANTLNRINVPPATPEETMKILQDRVPYFEYQHKSIFTVWALKEAYRLSEKYVHDMEMPGRALNLLEASAGFAQNGFVMAESVQMAVEKTYGVKMQASQDGEERNRLLNMEELIHQRMIGQKAAVKAVSDALRRSAAGVRNESRPIGTFLFLGPTGVGKTELAKALSEVYFNGESSIVRIDLNEFVEASSVDRLIADGATDENSLTAQVMKSPFSVVLLDEIEKAHPKVLTTLLQLLDEGILRDVRNREVSFRDTIIVATSNAGADKIREYIDQGMDLSAVKEELSNSLIASGEFKPEFLNRFDEICVFKPLTKDDLMQIISLILNGVNKTLEPRKIRVEVDDEGKALLVERGYDPKLGARPMRRIVQKTVENIIAKEVLAGHIQDGNTIQISAEMIEVEIDE